MNLDLIEKREIENVFCSNSHALKSLFTFFYWITFQNIFGITSANSVKSRNVWSWETRSQNDQGMN